MKIFVPLIAAIGIFWVNNVSAADLSKLVEENLHHGKRHEGTKLHEGILSDS